MKKYLSVLFIILFLPVMSCDARAVAVFEETAHDFGNVKKDSTYKHTFNFKNKGKKTLKIERIKTA